MSSGAWETPLGPALIDSGLAEALKKRFPLLTEDADAHRSEHAIEVELPFIQSRRPDFRFVPIALGTGQFDTLEKLGEAIAETVQAEDDRILIVASSDMNHYENDAVTRLKDHMAIERMLALDARGLFDVVMKEEISMCGFGPAVVMLTAAKRLGATKAELIKYATSGDVSGDREMVVGYAGVVVR
jgi:AmmeMemoRadiSam system protein B